MNYSLSQTDRLRAAAVFKLRERKRNNASIGKQTFELRGNNLAVQTMTDEEILLVGAAGTGKTLAWLTKVHHIAQTYPGARIAIVRKVRADLAQTVLVTFERDVLGLDNPICQGVRRENRQSYRYPNGSEIVVGGMDRPGKILGGEYHIIYLNEAVEFTLTDYEFFVMRLGRDEVVPFSQLIADTNPSYPSHWLKQRCDAGICKLLNTFHEDNPAYWSTVLKDWTERGKKYVLGKLARLSGVRGLRFRDGKWAQSEGAVYDEWNESIHLIDHFDPPIEWRRIRVIDFGYGNPFVCQWWAIDPDGRMYLYREIYRTKRIVEDHAKDINRLSEGENIEATIADHDAEDRATLERHGISTLAAKKNIKDGIELGKERLRVQGDGKPRAFVMRGALVERDEELAESGLPVCTADEFSAYVWPKDSEGKPKKELPLDLNNHGMDDFRYGAAYLENVGFESIGTLRRVNGQWVKQVSSTKQG